MNRNRPRPPHARQQGAVLIISMIFLIIMTLLAVTGMNTSSMEEKMASNSQEATRAFQAAETGLAQAFDDVLSYDITGTYVVAPGEMFTGSDLSTDYRTDFLNFSSAPPLKENAQVSSVIQFQAANFDLVATGSTAGGITVTVHGGAFQILKDF